MARQYYTMKIAINPDHRLKSHFVQPRFVTIETQREFDRLIARLKTATVVDHQGRILCYGSDPKYSYAEQKRIYVAKWGHDDRLWENLTASGQAIRQQLPK